MKSPRKRQLRLNPVNEALYLKCIVKAICTRWRHGMLATILIKPQQAKLDQHVISFIHKTSSKAKKTSVK